MRTEQLEYLAVITRCGSLRRAGEELHMSQPALSEAITKLERELGVTLLDRQRTGTRISRSGQELLQPIADVLEAVERLKAAAGSQLAARRLVRVGTVNAGTALLLLPAIRDYQDRHPNGTIEIRNLLQAEIETGLLDGALDIGLVNLLDGDDVPPNLEKTPLIAGSPVAVIPAGHRLAGAAEVSADDLRAAPFIAMRSGYVMYRFAHRLFGSRLPADWHTTDGAEMGKMMVAEGLGLTILPSYSVVGDPLERAGLLVARPIAGDPTAVRMIALHRRQARTPVAVLDLLRQLGARAGSAAAIA